MRLVIRPYDGVGPINFGMSMQETRAAVGTPFESFKKTPIAELPTDAFDSVGVHVYYKKPGICEAVEMASPAEPIFQDRPLLGRPFAELRNWFKTIDPRIEVDAAGLTSHEFGIALYAPSAEDEPQLPVEGVLVFAKGYYD
jgi:hypothetical protein